MIKLNKIIFLNLFVLILLLGSKSMADEKRDKIQMTLKDGVVVIETRPDVAPKHVDQITKLISEGQYDGVVFHRVIEGFMAQTGDVQFGNILTGYSSGMVGRGGSDFDNIQAEFSNIPFDRGIVGMARAQDPDSANSQFFIMFQDGHFLNGNYTVFGKVLSGMDIVDKIKKGDPNKNGMIQKDPDFMNKVIILEN